MTENQIVEVLEVLGPEASLDDVDDYVGDLIRLAEVGDKIMPLVLRNFPAEQELVTPAVILALFHEGRLGEVIENGKKLFAADDDWADRRERAQKIVRDDPHMVAAALQHQHPELYRVVDLLEERINADVAAGTHVPYDPDEPHPLASHPDELVAMWFRRDPVPLPKTVKAARQRLAARTGWSMRAIIAETVYMQAAQIDAIAA